MAILRWKEAESKDKWQTRDDKDKFIGTIYGGAERVTCPFQWLTPVRAS